MLPAWSMMVPCAATLVVEEVASVNRERFGLVMDSSLGRSGTVLDCDRRIIGCLPRATFSRAESFGDALWSFCVTLSAQGIAMLVCKQPASVTSVSGRPPLRTCRAGRLEGSLRMGCFPVVDGLEVSSGVAVNDCGFREMAFPRAFAWVLVNACPEMPKPLANVLPDDGISLSTPSSSADS